MIATYRYRGQSGIVNALNRSRLAFATNTVREAVAFHGRVTQPLLLRETLAALYHVVVSDFKYRPRDRLAFKAWLEEQDRKFLEALAAKSAKARERLTAIEARLGELSAARAERLKPFHKARLEFFNYMYEREYEMEFLFDPVITVHPDEVSFEAFSRDESSYARLAAGHELFDGVGGMDYGTTNIDFSAKLHGELERMRSYRQTSFGVDPQGFTVATENATHKEKKIDLPDSWVKGFLQVHSVMSMGLTRFSLDPIDLYNVCRFLRRKKAKVSPRALRYEFTPGKPGRVVLEPWEHVVELAGVPKFDGPKPVSVRTWGRNRLLTLARLIPYCRRIDVYLAGFGLPSIYVVDLGPIVFTLALSGWTDNDWTGGPAKFDQLARRLPVTAPELLAAYNTLRASRRMSDASLAAETGFGIEKARSALSYLCEAGRAMIDLGGNVYRHRDLFPEPFTPKDAAKVTKPAPDVSSPQAKAAQAIFQAGGVFLTSRRPVPTGYKLTGSAQGSGGGRVRPLLHVDHEGRIIEAECTCPYHQKSKLTKGPCEHILALRLAHMSRLEQEDAT